MNLEESYNHVCMFIYFQKHNTCFIVSMSGIKVIKNFETKDQTKRLSKRKIKYFKIRKKNIS